MCVKTTPLYHRCIGRGPDAGAFYLLPIWASEYAIERAMQEKERLLQSGKRVVPAPNPGSNPSLS